MIPCWWFSISHNCYHAFIIRGRCLPSLIFLLRRLLTNIHTSTVVTIRSKPPTTARAIITISIGSSVALGEDVITTGCFVGVAANNGKFLINNHRKRFFKKLYCINSHPKGIFFSSWKKQNGSRIFQSWNTNNRYKQYPFCPWSENRR